MATGAQESVARRLQWSALSAASGFLAAAFASVIISRLVDPAAYGGAAVIMAAWGFLVSPIEWCGSLVARFGPVELEKSGRISRVLGTRLVFAIPAMALLGPVVLFIIQPWARWSWTVVALTFAWLIVSLAHDLARWTAIAAQEFRATAIAQVLTRSLPIPVVLASAVIPFTIRAEHLLAATTGATAVGALFLAVALRSVAEVGRPDRDLLRRMWSYISPALVGAPATVAKTWVDPILLARYVGPAEVGFYQLAYTVIAVGGMVTSSIIAVVSPELVRANSIGKSGVQARFVREQQAPLALTLGLLAFAVACLADPLMRFVIGVRFAPSGRIAAVLCVAAGFMMATATLYAIVTATDGQPAAQAANIVQAIVNVVGDVFLGRAHGAMGVAYANVLAWAASGILLSALLRTKVPTRLGFWWILGLLAPGVLLFVSAEPPVWLRVIVSATLLAGAVVPARRIIRSGASPDPDDQGTAAPRKVAES
jgi:O-antigen/teichoic acid export membrane protein